MGKAKKSIVTTRRRIDKDAAKTAAANAKGGRYYKATVVDKIAAVTGRKYR
jgi:hypothetical protein